MLNYDEIIEMLDWNNPPEIQNKGLELAREVKCLNVFVQPFIPNSSKSLWKNCAIVLSEKSDDELIPHVAGMLNWLRDLNVPGAEIILERLKNFKSYYLLSVELKDAKTIAKAFNERFWFSLIEEIEESLNRNSAE